MLRCAALHMPPCMAHRVKVMEQLRHALQARYPCLYHLALAISSPVLTIVPNLPAGENWKLQKLAERVKFSDIFATAPFNPATGCPLGFKSINADDNGAECLQLKVGGVGCCVRAGAQQPQHGAVGSRFVLVIARSA